MKITKNELKATFKGVLLGLGTWWVAVPLRDKLPEVFNTDNTIGLGVIMILIVLLWD